MYEPFYNFSADPFRLNPDHRFCFSHPTYATAMAYLQYALKRAEGFVMVTGQPGSGKTTLANDLLNGLDPTQFVVAKLVSTQLEADDFLRMIAFELGIDAGGIDKASVLREVEQRLMQHARAGRRTLLVVDETQDLPACAFNEMRLLSNMQSNGQSLAQMFIFGQDELRKTVKRPEMEALHQRLIAACHLEPLSVDDTEAYIKHRLRQAGWTDDPQLDDNIFSFIHEYSKGVPRRINLICSRLLLYGATEDRHALAPKDIKVVAGELGQEMLSPVNVRVLPPGFPAIGGKVFEGDDGFVTAPRKSKQSHRARSTRKSSPVVIDADSHEMKTKERPIIVTNEPVEPSSGAQVTPAYAHEERVPKREPRRRYGMILTRLGIIACLVFASLYVAQPNRVGAMVSDLPTHIATGIETLIGILDLHSQGDNTRGEEPDVPSELPELAPPVDTQPTTIDERPEGAADDKSAAGTSLQLPKVVVEIEEQEVSPLPTPTTETASLVSLLNGSNLADEADRPLISTALEGKLRLRASEFEWLTEDRLRLTFSNTLVFNYSRSQVVEAFTPTLDLLAGGLDRHALTIVHVYNAGSSPFAETLNRELSQRRAIAVADYLVSRGVPVEHLTIESMNAVDAKASAGNEARAVSGRRLEIYVAPLDESAARVARKPS